MFAIDMENNKIAFAKMHGAGNDYVYIDATKGVPPYDLASLARCISDRHFGIGGDGMVLIMKSERADFRMRMFNSDGSEAQMCGNATRCIGKYVYDKGLTDKRVFTLETLGGIKVLDLHLDKEGKVESVTVDMGIPSQEKVMAEVPADGKGEVTIDEETYSFVPVNMGNPHAVVFGKGIVDDRHVLEVGPKMECAEVFPEKANIEFAEVTDAHNITMRVWERGTGETLACGTGSCATAVAAVMQGLAERNVTIHLLGGDLQIFWNPENNHVMMTGPATFVAEGEYFVPSSLKKI